MIFLTRIYDNQQHFFPFPEESFLAIIWLEERRVEPDASTGLTRLRKAPFATYFLCKTSAALLKS